VALEDETNYNYLLSWVAHLLQKPGEKPGVAVVMRGGKGIGKGMFVTQILAKIIGTTNFIQVTNPEHITGKFNLHLFAKLLYFADEAFFAGDVRTGKVVDSLISEPLQMLEKKGLDAIQVVSYSRLIMATNEEWSVRASEDERRYFLLDVSSVEQQKADYFNELGRAIPAELPAFKHSLMNLNIDGFDWYNAPKTAALQEQIIYSKNTMQAWVEAWQSERRMLMRDSDGEEITVIDLEAGGDMLEAPVKKVYESYLQYARAMHEQHPLSSTAFGIRLHKMVKVEKFQKRAGGRSANYYRFWASKKQADG
jgi:hypothetical protein